MTPDQLFQDCINRLNDADRCRLSGDLDHAAAICRDLVERFPAYWAAQHTLGLVYLDKRDYQKALEALVQASILHPGNWKTLLALAEAYLNLGGNKPALGTVQAALAATGGNADLYYMLGETHRRTQQYELAEEALREALKIDPKFHSATMSLGLCRIETGDTEGAARLFENLIAVDPGFADALFRLAGLPVHTGVDLLKLLEKYELGLARKNPDTRTTFWFAKAATLDRAGRHEEAWRLFETANAGMHDQMREELERIQKYQRLFLERLPHFISSVDAAAPNDTGAKDVPFSLAVLGPSRSGKSTVEYLLSKVAGIRRGYENDIVETALNATCALAGLPVISSDHLPAHLFARFRETYLRELASRAGGAEVFVNTNPALIKDIVLMLKAVPNTRVIFVKRNLRDNAFRMFTSVYAFGNAYSYNLQVINDYLAWYNACIDIIASHFGSVARIVTYDDIVANPRSLYRTAAELLPLDFAPAELPPIGDDRGCSIPYVRFMGV
jgi:tetratricopeptide (TPR) repeat protein